MQQRRCFSVEYFVFLRCFFDKMCAIGRPVRLHPTISIKRSFCACCDISTCRQAYSRSICETRSGLLIFGILCEIMLISSSSAAPYLSCKGHSSSLYQMQIFIERYFCALVTDDHERLFLFISFSLSKWPQWKTWTLSNFFRYHLL